MPTAPTVDLTEGLRVELRPDVAADRPYVLSCWAQFLASREKSAELLLRYGARVAGKEPVSLDKLDPGEYRLQVTADLHFDHTHQMRMQVADTGFLATRIGMDAGAMRMLRQQPDQLGATETAGAEQVRFETIHVASIPVGRP